MKSRRGERMTKRKAKMVTMIKIVAPDLGPEQTDHKNEWREFRMSDSE